MTEAVVMKVCNRCGETKDAEKDYSYYGGIKKPKRKRAVCKACINEANKQHQKRYRAEALNTMRMCKVCGEVKEPDYFEPARHQCKVCRYEIERQRLMNKRAEAAAKPIVHKPLQIPRERATTKGDIRQTPAPVPNIPGFRKSPTYGIAQFWAEFPESHREWYMVLREDSIPASSKLYAHPLHDKYVPGKVVAGE